MKRLILAAAAAITAGLTTAPAMAASVSDCGDVSRLENVVEPWEGSTKTFYGGKMRVVLVDTGGEPACCSTYLAVLYSVEPNDEPPYTACKLIKDDNRMGFAGIDFRSMRATYDARAGVLLTIRAKRMKADGSGTTPLTLKVRLRQSPPSVRIER